MPLALTIVSPHGTVPLANGSPLAPGDNVRADGTQRPDGTVSPVRFVVMNDKQPAEKVLDRVERSPPLFAWGDDVNGPKPWPFGPGQFVLMAIASVDDVQVLHFGVVEATPPPAPVPPPTPAPEPVPSPVTPGTVPISGAVQVPRGGDWRTFIRPGQTTLLLRGETYRQPFTPIAGMADVTLGVYGDPSLSPPVIQGVNGPTIVLRQWKNLTITGVDFVGIGRDKVIKLFGCENVTLSNCGISKGGFGITLELDVTVRCKNIRLLGCRIFDNDGPAAEDSSGVFASYTDGLTIDGCLLDHNGLGNGPATPRNHNFYCHASVTGLIFTNNVTSRPSSHGAQVRGGGLVKGNLFLDCPIALSFGLVNGGGPVFAGGVTGSIEDNIFAGAGDITPQQERGMCIQIGNVKSAAIVRNWFGSDTTTGVVFPTISIEPCHLDPGHHGGNEVGVLDLSIQQNRMDRKGKPVHESITPRRMDCQTDWHSPLPDVRARLGDPAAWLEPLRRPGSDVKAAIAAVKVMAGM